MVWEWGSIWWNRKANAQEVRESTSLDREQQTCGTCCHRNLEEDHVSRCKKCSNTFMDSKVPKQLCQNPDRRSQLTKHTDNRKWTKLPNGVRSIPASSSEPQDLMFQGVASTPIGRAWSTNTQQGQHCLSKHKAESVEIKATRERNVRARSENKT